MSYLLHVLGWILHGAPRPARRACYRLLSLTDPETGLVSECWIFRPAIGRASTVLLDRRGVRALWYAGRN